MDEALLHTKLFRPPVRPSRIPRPALIDRLNSGLAGKLTLVSAPAGFGKTTLVADWLAQGERPFAWVSLDEDDNAPRRFFTYLAAAIQQIAAVGRSIEGLLQSSQPVPLKSLAISLINDCLTAAAPFVLVLDDYHVITATTVHEAVTYLLDHLPPQLHLVITSRTDPLLPLPRLRARGQITELRTDELRFTTPEAAAFLRQAMGLNLSARQVSALEARTEGWVAGLQMAALSLHGRKDAADITAFVTDFAGSHRYIFDYLTDEVLQQRPADTRDFLLKTALLDRFNASLCTAVTGQENSRAILHSLEKANLFLFPLDEEREWYRYHHLFADLLRQRLHLNQPDKVPDLYRRASRWYADAGDVEQAVRYALAGEDPDAATRLLDQFATHFVRRSEIAKLHDLLSRLPPHASDGFPRLNVAQGWVFMFLGEYDTAEKYALQAEANLERPAELSPDFPEAFLRAQVATIRAYCANRQGRLTMAQTYSREALNHLDRLPDELAFQLRGSVLINYGQIQVALNNVEQAEESYRLAISFGQASGRFFGVMAAYASLLFLLRQLGKLTEAQAMSGQGLAWLRRWQEQHPIDYPAESEFRQAVGEIYYARNELREAQEHFQRGVEVSRYTVPARYLNCLHHLFLVALAEKEVETAVTLHQQIESDLQGYSLVPWSLAAQRSDRLIRLSRLGDAAPLPWREELRQWLLSLETLYTTTFKLHLRRVTLVVARARAALDDLDPALELLNRLADEAEAARRSGDLIACRVQQAIVYSRMAQEETAVTHLTQAVALAERTGHLRLLLDEAAALHSLLPHLPASPYRDKLEAVSQADYVSAATSIGQPDQSSLIDPLSDRELEVLVLLTTHLSGPEIAGKLHISRNTFKSHTKNIYGKLGVRSRNKAVSRGRELGLLK